ncbi:hypothetical protein VB712_05005 [Spirulina sp. CCNP1310]|nr:hypothetical protein [Spirulina sp. CCNP1310]MEA5418576.1 hypothetical protein [Spirulina sp. CCNP1310]
MGTPQDPTPERRDRSITIPHSKNTAPSLAQMLGGDSPRYKNRNPI